MKNNKGFTLVELLVVIAIIGILSTVAVVNLNSARSKAVVASAKAWGSSLGPAVVLCQNEGGIIEDYASDGSFCCDDAVCTTDLLATTQWPTTVPQNYETVTVVDGTIDDGTWSITIADTQTTYATVTCTQSGCTTP